MKLHAGMKFEVWQGLHEDMKRLFLQDKAKIFILLVPIAPAVFAWKRLVQALFEFVGFWLDYTVAA